MAAPPMNPTMAACDRKSTRNPNLQVTLTQFYNFSHLPNKTEEFLFPSVNHIYVRVCSLLDPGHICFPRKEIFSN